MTASIKHDVDPASRECVCGEIHSREWWHGYDAGRNDGFEEAADWGGTYCEACGENH